MCVKYQFLVMLPLPSIEEVLNERSELVSESSFYIQETQCCFKISQNWSLTVVKNVSEIVQMINYKIHKNQNFYSKMTIYVNTNFLRELRESQVQSIIISISETSYKISKICARKTLFINIKSSSPNIRHYKGIYFELYKFP